MYTAGEKDIVNEDQCQIVRRDLLFFGEKFGGRNHIRKGGLVCRKNIYTNVLEQDRSPRLTFQGLDNEGSRPGSVFRGQSGQQAFDGPLSRIKTVEDFGSFKIKVHCIKVFYRYNAGISLWKNTIY